MNTWGWQRYVPVAERRQMALREMAKLRKKGKTICPVEIEGRTIARTFWGKGWCTHLESFSDYENRLPRGRTYARNGSVCHVEINKGHIAAIVSGSELYNVTITIRSLPATKWSSIKKLCAGQIGSMLELLQGRISKQVMEVVANRTNGLFPLPGEIDFTCSCPDDAVMCKHVAAVLYGVGNRLDCDPGLLFELRGLDAQELIAEDMNLFASHQSGQADTLADQDLGGLFGIEMDTAALQEPVTTKKQQPSKKKPRKTSKHPQTKTAAPANSKSSSHAGPSKRTPKTTRSKPAGTTQTAAKPKRFSPTGPKIRKLRQAQGLSFQEFADRVGACENTIRRWESKRGKTKMRPEFFQALQNMFDELS
jgi:uncharacterized Zn finger protein